MLRNLRKKFAPLNFHKRNETDADFEAIEFGRCGHVIYRTETDVNNLKLKFNSSQPRCQNDSVQLISNESIVSLSWTTWKIHSLTS